MGECPELDDAGKTTISYFVGGAAVTDDDSGFGLDAYEPLFFNSQDWWAEQNAANPWKVTLTIAADPEYATIYYFCHIHAGMSAIIDITGSTASPAAGSLNPAVLSPALTGAEDQASAVAIYHAIKASEQATLDAQDETCGTHSSASFFADGADVGVCSGKEFLCGDGATSEYSKCLAAVDCQMHKDMAVSIPASDTSKFATFARQMIPHHQNAVAMAKILQKFDTADDYPTTEDQNLDWATSLTSSIINVQNKQIQELVGWLDANADISGTSTNCYDDSPITATATTSAPTEQTSAGTMKSGVSCTPTGTNIKLKWDMFASEWGAYTVDGCDGVNPRLQLAADAIYTFDQSDASNW